MDNVYNTNLSEAMARFKKEYPDELYGPTKCSFLTTIAHDSVLRSLFDSIFPGILEEYKNRNK